MNRLRAIMRDSGDEGLGMILVIGTTTVVMALMLVTGSIALRSLDSGRTHDSFSTSLTAAEAGVDQALARVQAAYDFNGSDFRTPHASATDFDASPDCVASETDYAYDLDSDATAAEETAWAKEKLYALAQIPGCLKTTARGQYVMLKPTGRQTVYAMGWSPAFVPPETPGGPVPEQRERMIKAEYIFAPFKPAHAILTGGSLALESGSTDVDNALPGVGASVHSNGDVTIVGQPNVSGTVSWTGSGPATGGNFGGREQSPRQGIPTIEASALYGKEVVKSKYATSWYDLCPDGIVRRGDTTPPIAPCTGTVVDSDGSFANGWTFEPAVGTDPPTWEVDEPNISGVYYVSQADVLGTASNGDIANMTIIASAKAPTSCDKVGGNIHYDGHLDIAAPAMDGTFLYADQDIAITENNTLGTKNADGSIVSGGFFAGDQFESTRSSSHLYGSVIAGDECDPADSLVDDNLVKASDITFDPNGYTPLTDVVNTTLWLELTG